MSTSWHAACRASELANGGLRACEIGGWPILLARANGEAAAVIDRCTHQASRLAEGRVRRGAIVCPQHGALFSLTTGACLGGAGYAPLKTFAVREREGWMEVETPNEAPGEEHRPVAATPA